MEPDIEAALWTTELESLLLRVGQRFGRIEPRRRMQDYVRGLLGPVGRKNSWQLAEHVGHATPYPAAAAVVVSVGSRRDP